MQLHINSLRVCDTLIVDCEGNNLGTPSGTLSLITVRRLAPPSATYIFDAVALSTTALNPIFNLLESPLTVKVLYDGRMDFACLFHDFGITMNNVLDMQLADIQSRSERGERDNDRLERLYTAIPQYKIQSKGVGSFQQIHKLSGLVACIAEHGFTQYQKLPGTSFYITKALSQHIETLNSGSYPVAGKTTPRQCASIHSSGCRHDRNSLSALYNSWIHRFQPFGSESAIRHHVADSQTHKQRSLRKSWPAPA